VIREADAACHGTEQHNTRSPLPEAFITVLYYPYGAEHVEVEIVLKLFNLEPVEGA
jgi:hypothetical protein